jgi:hypothetical protein
MSQIENNIKSFLDWGFLNIGGFINVQKGSNNIYGNPLAKLKPTEDPNFTTGQVWQPMRKDWIWEEGVQFSNCVTPPLSSPYPSEEPIYDPCPSEYIQYSEPTLISGIYINNTFYPPTTTGQYAYIIDYVHSRVIFNSPVSLSLDIQMEYSYRWVQVYNYDNAKWWQQLQYKTDANAVHFDQLSKGDFSILSTNRVQLPAIIIESVSRGLSRPFQLGDKSLVMKQELMLHIVAETMADRNMIIDVIRLQQDKVIRMYDTNTVVKNGVKPYLVNGTLNPDRLQYNLLISDELYPIYGWRYCKLIDIFASDVESFSPFFSESNLKLTVELIFDINN